MPIPAASLAATSCRGLFVLSGRTERAAEPVEQSQSETAPASPRGGSGVGSPCSPAQLRVSLALSSSLSSLTLHKPTNPQTHKPTHSLTPIKPLSPLMSCGGGGVQREGPVQIRRRGAAGVALPESCGP
eukprot:2001906-Rhodomonas_salina.4